MIKGLKKEQGFISTKIFLSIREVNIRKTFEKNRKEHLLVYPKDENQVIG